MNLQTKTFSNSNAAANKLSSTKLGKEDILNCLDTLLSEEIALFHMTQLAHWNAEGGNFYSFHKLTEDQYRVMVEKIDTIAERKRALGGKVNAYNNVSDRQLTNDYSTQRLSKSLASLHKKQAMHAKGISVQADEAEDGATADLMNGLCRFHEEQAWILESMNG